MEGINPLFLAVSVAGVLLVLARLLPLLMSTVNSALLDAQLEKLIAAGNRDRALKLCQCIPRNPYASVLAALLTKSTELSARDGEGLVQTALGEAYQEAHEQARARVRRLGLLAPIGVVIAASASRVPLGIADAPPYAPFIPGGIALLLAIIAWRKVRGFEADWARGRERMIPVVAASVMRIDG